jgi:hypothetical protein
MNSEQLSRLRSSPGNITAVISASGKELISAERLYLPLPASRIVFISGSGIRDKSS